MEQSPSWEANRFSASQEIPWILWNPKVHYRIHKCLPPVPILSYLDSVHALPIYVKINLILYSHLHLSLSLRFPNQDPVYTSPLPICETCSTHFILLDLITQIRSWVHKFPAWHTKTRQMQNALRDI